MKIEISDILAPTAEGQKPRITIEGLSPEESCRLLNQLFAPEEPLAQHEPLPADGDIVREAAIAARNALQDPEGYFLVSHFAHALLRRIGTRRTLSDEIARGLLLGRADIRQHTKLPDRFCFVPRARAALVEQDLIGEAIDRAVEAYSPDAKVGDSATFTSANFSNALGALLRIADSIEGRVVRAVLISRPDVRELDAFYYLRTRGPLK